MELIYSLIVSPSGGMRRIGNAKPFSWAILIFVLALASKTTGDLLILGLDPQWAKILLALGLTGRIVTGFFVWLAASALLHLFAEVWRGKGEVSTLFTVLGFASLPLIFSSPLALVAKFCGRGEVPLYFLSTLFIFIWMIVLQILGLKRTYAFSLPRAILTYCSPFFLGLIMLGLLLSAFVLSLGSFISLRPTF